LALRAVGVEVLVITVMADVPDPVTVVGLNIAVAPDGRPVTENVTTPVNPLLAVTVDVYEGEVLPSITDWDDGLADNEKPVTFNVTVVVWFRLPLVPLMVRVEVAAGVDVEVITVSVVEPELVTVVGL
jgi:hypothetical protein